MTQSTEMKAFLVLVLCNSNLKKYIVYHMGMGWFQQVFIVYETTIKLCATWAECSVAFEKFLQFWRFRFGSIFEIGVESFIGQYILQFLIWRKITIKSHLFSVSVSSVFFVIMIHAFRILNEKKNLQIDVYFFRHLLLCPRKQRRVFTIFEKKLVYKNVKTFSLVSCLLFWFERTFFYEVFWKRLSHFGRIHGSLMRICFCKVSKISNFLHQIRIFFKKTFSLS
jgi:hypothetical protein